MKKIIILKIKKIFPISWFIGEKKFIKSEIKEIKIAPMIDESENLHMILWCAFLFAKNDPEI